MQEMPNGAISLLVNSRVIPLFALYFIICTTLVDLAFNINAFVRGEYGRRLRGNVRMTLIDLIFDFWNITTHNRPF